MDYVSVETVVRLVKLVGEDAVFDEAKRLLSIFPRGGTPVVYRVPPAGLGRRVIIQIGVKTGIPSHHFWHPERAEEIAAAEAAIAAGGKPS